MIEALELIISKEDLCNRSIIEGIFRTVGITVSDIEEQLFLGEFCDGVDETNRLELIRDL